METVQFLSGAPAALPAASAAGGPGLKRRVTMILTQKPARPGSWRALAVVAVAACACLPWGVGCTEAVQPPAAAEPVVAENVQDNPLQAPAQEQPPPRALNVQPPADPAQSGWPGGLSQSGRDPSRPMRERAAATLRDEIELLQVQVQIAEAKLKAAQATVAPAVARLKRMEQLATSNQVSFAELAQARSEVDLAHAQVLIREAELNEPRVRLRQAQRRLADLEKSGSATGRMEEQLRLLEQQERELAAVVARPDDPNLLALRKRIADVRAALSPRPADPGTVTQSAGGMRIQFVNSTTSSLATTASYRLINASNQRARISSMRLSAGFATARVKAQGLDPGEQTDLTVTIDRHRFSGPKTVTIHLAFDPPSLGELSMTVQAMGTGTDSTSSTTSRPADDAQMRALEKQIADLQKQLEELRKKMPAGDPARP